MEHLRPMLIWCGTSPVLQVAMLAVWQSQFRGFCWHGRAVEQLT